MSKYKEQDYINKCHELNLKYIGFGKQKKLGTMIEFICEKHKDKGVQRKDWSHFRTSKKGCPYCYGRNKTTEEFINEITNKDVIVISEFLGLEKPIRCKCKKCNNEWTTQARVLSKNNGGCPICGIKKRNLSETKSQEQFENELSLRNPFITVLGEYKNTHTKILCKCNMCNNEWFGYPANLLNGSAGCNKCNCSDGERKMLSLLDEFGINHHPQFEFDDCRNILPLKYDAYDEENKVAFEYNGEQHYKNSNIKGHYIDDDELKKIKHRDLIKEKYCKENDITLIIIPYWEKNNMREFLLSQFSERKIYC